MSPRYPRSHPRKRRRRPSRRSRRRRRRAARPSPLRAHPPLRDARRRRNRRPPPLGASLRRASLLPVDRRPRRARPARDALRRRRVTRRLASRPRPVAAEAEAAEAAAEAEAVPRGPPAARHGRRRCTHPAARLAAWDAAAMTMRRPRTRTIMADAARGARTARGASTSDCTTCTPVTWRGRRTRDSNRTARSPPARPPAMLCTSRVRSAARCLRGGRVRRHSAVPRRDRTFGWERPQLLGQPPTAQSPLHHVTPDAVACWMGVTRPSSLALAQARTTSKCVPRGRCPVP